MENMKEYNKKRYKKRRKQQLKNKKESYNKNPEKYKKISREYRKNNPEKFTKEILRKEYLKNGRNTHLKRTYGISLKEYNEMISKQNYKCAICGSENAGSKGTFMVDHNHKTNKVRGLLCNDCNLNLGYYERMIDNNLLIKSKNYLKKYV